MKLKHALIIVLLLSLIGCNSNNKDFTESIDRDGYSILYPPTLKLDDSGIEGSEFVLLTEKTDAEDGFIENINLIIQDLQNTNLDLNKFVETAEEQIGANGKLIESKRIENSDPEFHKLIYVINSDNYDLKFIQYYFVVGSKAYFLTYTAEENNFDKYAADMERVMKTFKVSQS